MSHDHARSCFNGLVGFRLRLGLVLGLSIRALFGQHSANPVLLVNGFQSVCPDGGGSGTFGNLQQLLDEDGASSVDFFDVCSAPDSSIESLAGLLTAKIQSYPGPVDVIAHSMGGLIVRAYLQGWTTAPYLNPPINPKIRKLVLLGTPNFGVSNKFLLLSLVMPWTSNQVAEMQFGSPFLLYLATWNQLYDDLRGVDAVAVTGTAGIDAGGVPWDGVVDVASASIDFADSSGLRTFAVPYCHTGVVLLACQSGAGMIASVTDRSHLSYQLLRSFLDGNNNLGAIAPQASSVSTTGGIQFSLSDPNGNAYTNQLSSVSLVGNGNSPLLHPVWNSPVWSNNDSTAGTSYNLVFDLGAQQYSLPGISVPSGGFVSLPLKFPPEMTFVTSSAARPPGAVSVAPDSLVTIYGAGLASGMAQASLAPWPYQLADASLTLGGVPVHLQYASAQQINALIPAVAPGLYPLVLTTSQGKHSINLMVDQIVPTFFALSGNAAAAVHSTTGQVVTSANPASIGEYVSFFGTGLGPTYSSKGLSIAQTTPTVFVDGQPAIVTFAGRAPGFVGLDQINVQIPSGVQSGPSKSVVMTSGNRFSNTVSLAVH